MEDWHASVATAMYNMADWNRAAGRRIARWSEKQGVVLSTGRIFAHSAALACWTIMLVVTCFHIAHAHLCKGHAHASINTCVCFKGVDVIVDEQKAATDACICYPFAATVVYASWLAVVAMFACGCAMAASLASDIRVTKMARRVASELPVLAQHVDEPFVRSED